jgi:cholest-4-en-3-one 26-monooxygenase
MKRIRFNDPDLYLKGTPYALFAELRRESPVSWQLASANPRDGFWLVMKHKDICQVSRTPAQYNSQGGTLLVDAPPKAMQVGPWNMVANHMGALDPPRHTLVRGVISPNFTPKAVAELEGRIRKVATEVIDEVIERGECDFAEEVALALPVRVVLGELLGIPKEERAKVVDWSNILVAPEDRTIAVTPESALQALDGMYEYGLALVRERRKNPQNDIISVLALSKTPDGNFVSDEMFTQYWFPFIIGAFDTTASSTSGGMLALFEHPGERQRLNEQPELLLTAVEEMLRWTSPVIYFRRTAAQDLMLGGQRIRKGQRVVLCYPSANRDEEVFKDPEVFDIARKPNEHLAFGFGPHFCLGARVAQLQIRVFMEEILRRMPSIEPAGEVVRIRSAWMNRIKNMPVRFKPGPREGAS